MFSSGIKTSPGNVHKVIMANDLDGNATVLAETMTDAYIL